MTRLASLMAACLLTGIADVALAADGLGRLFFVPAQRAQLDVARSQRDRRTVLSTVDTAEPTTPQGPDVITYNGIVRRNDGKSTVWINGKPLTERTQDSNVVVRRDGAVAVTVPQADRSASLKVGQSLDVPSGAIEEPYTRRATIARPVPKPAPAGGAAPSKPEPIAATGKPSARQVRERDARSEDGDDGTMAAQKRTAGK